VSILERVRASARGAVRRLAARLTTGVSDVVRRSFGRVLVRVRSLWANSVARTETIGQTLSRDDPWYIWELGNTEKHCRDCLHLNGQIHRASEWRAAGIAPQSPDLECGGWHCDCKLRRLDDHEGGSVGEIGVYG
jgi:hypothetical protein